MSSVTMFFYGQVWFSVCLYCKLSYIYTFYKLAVSGKFNLKCERTTRLIGLGGLSSCPFRNCFLGSQEQSYSNLNSGWSLAWDHFHGLIANPCGIIGRVVADVVIGVLEIVQAPMPIIVRLTKHCKTL